MNQYKTFIKTKLFTFKECDETIDLFHQTDKVYYNIYTHQGTKVSSLQADISPKQSSMLYEKTKSAILQANIDAGWNFDLTDWHQPLRISEYGRGNRHDWHTDYSVNDKSKIAMSCFLGGDYEGGGLELQDEKQVKLRRGEAIFFPAYHSHRVLPITKGKRYVLLGWFTGPRFR